MSSLGWFSGLHGLLDFKRSDVASSSDFVQLPSFSAARIVCNDLVCLPSFFFATISHGFWVDHLQ